MGADSIESSAARPTNEKSSFKGILQGAKHPRVEPTKLHVPKFKSDVRSTAKHKRERRCARSDLDSPTTSEFVSYPSFPGMQRRKIEIFAWPASLEDEIVAPPLQAAAIRERGIMLISDLCKVFVARKGQHSAGLNASLGLAVRLLDASLASSLVSKLKEDPILAGGCLMLATKLIETHQIQMESIVSITRNLDYVEEPFTVDRLAVVELALKQALDWDLYRFYASTPLQFVNFMLRDKRWMTQWQINVLRLVMDICYSDIRMCSFRPSVQAAAVMAVAKNFLGSQGGALMWREPSSVLNPQWEQQLSECTTILNEEYVRTVAGALRYAQASFASQHSSGPASRQLNLVATPSSVALNLSG